jgi:hypothetical protein
LTKPDQTYWEDVAFSEFCQDKAGGGGPFPEQSVIQRMIRRGPWKLNYYHGYPCQLFNLEEDPRETMDRATDPACLPIIEDLKAELFNGWAPQQVAERMIDLRQDRDILAAWGKHVQPPDSIRWNLKPEMDYLDENQMKG